jgi:hypothetical protein
MANPKVPQTDTPSNLQKDPDDWTTGDERCSYPVLLHPRGFVAGPWITSPLSSNREPWQGQSQVRSVAFQPTMQPM